MELGTGASIDLGLCFFIIYAALLVVQCVVVWVCAVLLEASSSL